MPQPSTTPSHGEGVWKSMTQDPQGLLSTLGSVVRKFTFSVDKEITLPLLLSFSR